MSLEVQGQPSPGPHAVGEAARRSRYCVACGAHHARPLFRDLVTCSACGMIYYPHRLAPEEVTRLYSEAYFGGAEYYDYLADRPVHEANFRARVRHLARWLPRGRHLLEVGCSYGFFLNLARARWRVRGCDIATEPCRYAREILGLDVLAGDFLEIPLRGTRSMRSACGTRSSTWRTPRATWPERPTCSNRAASWPCQPAISAVGWHVGRARVGGRSTRRLISGTSLGRRCGELWIASASKCAGFGASVWRVASDRSSTA